MRLWQPHFVARLHPAALLLVVACAGGCLPFPLPHRWRPAFDGVVRAPDGRPAADVRVVACTNDGWHGYECTIRGETRSDESGRFHFTSASAWRWLFLVGEPDRPTTFVIACASPAFAVWRLAMYPKWVELQLARENEAAAFRRGDLDAGAACLPDRPRR
jgi:hypothetical protein